MSFTILNANANHIPLTDKSVQCVVTSPPYWGLRDYGQVGQIGLEPTPEEYVAKIVAVFAEVWRVLRDDGTCWVNLGDSYAQGSKSINSEKEIDAAVIRAKERGYDVNGWGGTRRSAQGIGRAANTLTPGLKAKDLVGIPWRVAFALQAAGWYLRSDIIWSKPNPMPESVTDRPTKAHEYIFLLTKKERYFFDQDAVRETTGNEMSWDEYAERTAPGATWPSGGMMNYAGAHKHDGGHAHPNGRNIRTVWEIATQPYPEAHFATFPEEIAIRCIKAGTSEKGACAGCGAPYERVTETRYKSEAQYNRAAAQFKTTTKEIIRYGDGKDVKTTGWQPTCKHDAPTVPCIVLDPFSGAGTVPLVADKLNRRGIGLELKSDYCRMAHDRCYDDAPLLAAMEG